MLAYRDGADLVATVYAFGLGAAGPADELEEILARAGFAEPLVGVGARTLLHFVFGHTFEEQTALQAESAGAIERLGRGPRRRLRPRPRPGARRPAAPTRPRPGVSGAEPSGAEVDLGAVQLREQHRAGQVEPGPLQPGDREVHPVEGRPAQVGPAQPRLPQAGPVQPRPGQRGRR